MENKTTYTITIIDNTTGRIEFEEKEAHMIIGAVGDAEGAHGMSIASAKALTILNTLDVAQRAIRETTENLPGVKQLLELRGLLKDLIKEETTNE